MLIVLAVVLGGLSLYLNQDSFRKGNIHLSHRSRPARLVAGRKRGGRDDNPEINPIVFFCDRKVRLTALKVIPVSDIETNKYPHPIWNLVSDSNSVPIKEFIYGLPIPGMRSAVKGTLPDPLQPGEKYRLLIETPSEKAEHDFEPVRRTP
ncbi:MAG TPA: hypothetical protein VLT36_24710 [Candidatus Dormibacteraeota bacterium]|nr:hypothetical protein [Candidatus Dormibacteraeota bacterium]